MRVQAGRQLVAAMTVAILATGCSGSFSFSVGGVDIETPAGELITGELSDQLELGEQTPACTIPEDPVEGTTFTCTGTLEDGGVVTYVGEVTEDDTFSLESTNALQTDIFEPEFHAQILSDNEGAALAREGVDCGTGTIVLADGMFTCDVQPDGEAPLTATITMPDTRDGSYEYVIE